MKLSKEDKILLNDSANQKKVYAALPVGHQNLPEDPL